MDDTAPLSPATGRHYGMDWLRIGAFGVLILYHIGMVFVHWPFHIKAQPVLEWVAVPMLAPNAWRLSLLFVVSGYASAAIFAKDGVAAGPRAGTAARFAWRRTLRLVPPLIFGAAVIVPPQPWVELTVQHAYARSYPAFWLHDYFRFGTLDGIVMPTWQHLWFVVYLWIYTLALALMLAILPAALRARLSALTDRMLAGPLVILVPLALLGINLALTWPGHSETHDLINDGPSHRIYFGMLLFGFYLRGAVRGWTAIERWWKAALVLAIAAYGVVAGLEIAFPGSTRPPPYIAAIFTIARLVQEWCAIVALIGVANRFWNRDHRMRATLNEGVFPFYIVHQTIIVVVFYWCLSAGLGNGASFAIVLAATVAGCWWFYRLGRAVPGLRLLIGLRGWRERPRDTAPQVGHIAGHAGRIATHRQPGF